MSKGVFTSYTVKMFVYIILFLRVVKYQKVCLHLAFFESSKISKGVFTSYIFYGRKM